MRKGTFILRAVASLSGGADTRFLAFKNPLWYRALASVREMPGTCGRGEEISQTCIITFQWLVGRQKRNTRNITSIRVVETGNDHAMMVAIRMQEEKEGDGDTERVETYSRYVDIYQYQVPYNVLPSLKADSMLHVGVRAKSTVVDRGNGESYRSSYGYGLVT